MPDIFSPAKRSDVMARIRSTGTTPEERLYELIRDVLGARRLISRNVAELPGSPDISIPSLRLLLFADGCFYHSCPIHGHEPKSNQDYWVPKLARNRQRDVRTRRSLRQEGWSVWRVWEHDLKSAKLAETERRLQRRLLKRIELLRRPSEFRF